MKTLIDELHKSQCSLVIRKEGQMTEFVGRGVSDLVKLLREPDEPLLGARVADKVVGKAAASLLAVGCVREVYAGTISQPALKLLKASGVAISYGKLVPVIMRSDGQEMCPMEALTLDAPTAREAVERIYSKLGSMPNPSVKQ